MDNLISLTKLNSCGFISNESQPTYSIIMVEDKNRSGKLQHLVARTLI